MKKLGAIFAALGVILIAAVGCNSSDDAKSTSDSEYESTYDPDYNKQVTNDLVRQVQVGMTEREVRKLLGEPKRIFGNPSEPGWLYTYGGKETVVWFQDDKVVLLPLIDKKPQ